MKDNKFPQVRLDQETYEEIKLRAKKNNRTISGEIRQIMAIAGVPKDGKYTNERRCVMVKHADGRIEIAPEFAATAEAPAEEQ